MSTTKSLKEKTNLDLVREFGKSAKDTGAVPVQVAVLTKRIDELSPHFEKHAKDFSGKRGLMKLVGKRKSLLRYLSETNPESYQKVIKELGLRK